MSPLRLALLNLTRRKIPSLIAVLAIAISVACSGILLRLNLLSQDRFSTLGAGGDAVVGAKSGGIEMILGALNAEGPYPGFLPYKLFESLRAMPTSFMHSVIPVVVFARIDGFRAIGTDESFLNRPMESGDSLSFSEGHWAQEAADIVVGSQVANARHLHIGDLVSLTPWAGDLITPGPAVEMKVSGILKPTRTAWDRMLFAKVSTAQQVLAGMDLSHSSIWGHDVLNYFLVYLRPGGFGDLANLINRRTVAETVLVGEQTQRLRALTGTGERLGFFITILILALGGLSVTSMLITRFEAMSLQLAVLRAIGYPKSAIGRWLLWEGFLLGICSCVLGLLLDLVGFPIMRGLLGEALPPPDLVASSIWYSFPIWATAILATTASVFIPLYRVYHQDVHFSLRS